MRLEQSSEVRGTYIHTYIHTYTYHIIYTLWHKILLEFFSSMFETERILSDVAVISDSVFNQFFKHLSSKRILYIVLYKLFYCPKQH